MSVKIDFTPFEAEFIEQPTPEKIQFTEFSPRTPMEEKPLEEEEYSRLEEF